MMQYSNPYSFEKTDAGGQKIKNITANLKIEPMLIHPTKWGYRNNKNKNNEHRIKSRPD